MLNFLKRNRMVWKGDGRMRILTSAQMKEAERRADAAGLSYRQMMENAGAAAARFIESRETLPGREVLILTGSGNNGGDGYVAARLLAEAGAQVRLVLVDGEPRTGDSRANRALALERGIPEIPLEALTDSGFSGKVAVDALYGTGFHGALRSRARQAVRWLNASGARVYALDLPSGLQADSGESDPDSVRAHVTIAFDSLKPAHRMEAASLLCGEVVCVDIGIPEECHPGEDAGEENALL